MVHPSKVSVPVDVELFLTINGEAIQLVNGPKPDPNKLPPVAMTPENQAAIIDALRAMRGMLLMWSGMYKINPGDISLTPFHDADLRGRIERVSKGITAAGLDNEATTYEQLTKREHIGIIQAGTPVAMQAHAVNIQTLSMEPDNVIPANGVQCLHVTPPMPPAPDGVYAFNAPAKCDGANVWFRCDGYNGKPHMATVSNPQPIQTTGQVYYNQKTNIMWYVPDIVKPLVSATPLCDGPQQGHPPGSVPVENLDERLLAKLKRIKQYSTTATQHGCRVDFGFDEAKWCGMTALDDATHEATPGRIYHNSTTGKTWFIADKPNKGPQ